MNGVYEIEIINQRDGSVVILRFSYGDELYIKIVEDSSRRMIQDIRIKTPLLLKIIDTLTKRALDIYDMLIDRFFET